MCIVHGPRLFQRRGPFQSPSLHRPFHRSLIHIHRRPALLTYQQPASCDRRLAPPIARLPLWQYSHLSAPSPHPVQWLLFFFTLTQCLEKNKEVEKRVEEEKESRSYHWQSPAGGGCKSIDSLGNGCRASERASSMAACD